MIVRLPFVILAAVFATAGAAQAQAPTPGKAELLWYSQAAFKLTTQTGKVALILVTHGDGDSEAEQCADLGTRRPQPDPDDARADAGQPRAADEQGRHHRAPFPASRSPWSMPTTPRR